MAIVDKIKSDIKFRNKVIAGAVVFVLAICIGVAGVLAMNNENDTTESDGSEDIQKEMALGVVPTDTTRVVSEKNVLYNEMDYFQEQENTDIVVVDDEKKVGKTKEEIAQMERQEDDEIASYIKRRREGMNTTYSSPSSQPQNASRINSYETSTYTAPSGTSRRKYNPYASSEDWTTTSGISDGLETYKTGREKEQQQQQQQEQTQIQHTQQVAQPQTRRISQKGNPTTFEELPPNEQRRILLETGKSSYEETAEFSAMIMSSGMIRPGQTITLITKEDAYISFEKIPKGTTIAGTVSFSDNRLQVNFSTIRIKKKIIKVSLTLYSLDGLAGLPIGTDLSNKDISDTGFEEATSENVTGTRLERIGKTLLKGAKQRRDVKVDLGRDIMCILVNNNIN